VGIAQKTPAGYWTFDVNAYLRLVAKQTRWDQIAGKCHVRREQDHAGDNNGCPPLEFGRHVFALG
jgi:hypothetical protein